MASPPRLRTTIENVPDGVLSNIFSRLLAKQVAQMRCVSKSWNAILSEPSFVKSHLHHSIRHKDEVFLFFRRGFCFEHSPLILRRSCSFDLELADFIKLPVDSQCKDSHGSVIGSMDGLICFKYGSHHDNFVIRIWNPSLSLVLTLPPCSLPSRDSVGIHFRFVFDPKTEDYKVVKLTNFVESFSMVPEVEVYSMRKGSWESISPRFPSHITWIKDQDEVFADGHDGHLHWLGFTELHGKQETIVAFDLSTETFSEIPLPDSLRHYHRFCINYLGVLSGKLCAMSRVVRDSKCEVWVMNEYGVAESWVKHHVLSQFSWVIKPYCITSHSEILYGDTDDTDHFGLYNPIAAKNKTFKIMPRPYSIGKIVEYIDSLVWIEPANDYKFKEASTRR